MKTLLKLTAILFSLGIPVSQVRAHETWLAPSSDALTPGEQVDLNLTSGMKFPVLEYAIKPERVALARYRLGTVEDALATPSRGKTALHFRQTFPKPGLVVAWVRLLPKTLELSPDKVAEYFEEIDAPREVRDLWASLRGKESWNETYTKCAKTFLRSGEDKGGDSSKKPVGLPFEIVPLTSIGSLRAGQSADFQLLENGAPLAHIAVGRISAGDPRAFFLTDANGRVNIPFARSGRTLLLAVHLQRAGNGPGWRSNFTTLTLKVANEH
ncbi:MAG: DUF4198 domain-containing protein [Chthoniobacterales bacterium]|nr:DUF4198 domain-containing protein [Chthoniobacterales bacterium]